MIKKIAIHICVILVLGVLMMSGRRQGVIDAKSQAVRFTDTVYYFLIGGEELEVSKYNFNKYKVKEYYKQGIME